MVRKITHAGVVLKGPCTEGTLGNTFSEQAIGNLQYGHFGDR